MLGLAAAGFGGLVLLCVAGISYAYAKTAVPTDVSQAAMQQQSTVYFSDGNTVVGTFGNTDRQLLQYNQISPLMRDAVVAAEDRSFYTEGGVSPKGIVRAAYEDVFNSGGAAAHSRAARPSLSSSSGTTTPTSARSRPPAGRSRRSSSR